MVRLLILKFLFVVLVIEWDLHDLYYNVSEYDAPCGWFGTLLGFCRVSVKAGQPSGTPKYRVTG